MNGKKSNNRRGGRKNANNNNTIIERGSYNYKQFRNNEKFYRFTQPGRFGFDRVEMTLKYHDPSATRTATGSSQSCNWRYRSSAYDPDPLLLTGAIPGYAEIANIYTYYRVLSITARVQIANQDTQAYTIVAWPSNNDNNNNSLSLADIAEYSGNVFAKTQVLGGANGMNVCTLRTAAFGDQLVGPIFRTDLDYSASTSSNPLAMYYLNIGAYSGLGNMAYPMVTNITLYYKIEFFRLRQLES